MTIPKYTDRLSWGRVPQEPRQARIALRYNVQETRRRNTPEAAEMLQDTFDQLVALAERGFLGAQGLVATVEVPGPDRLEIQLRAGHFPLDLIVIALRLLICANDHRPEDFQQLLDALDGDVEAAQNIYGGTNFDEEVGGIEILVEGAGPLCEFDPFHLGTQAGSTWHTQRLAVLGWAPYMPDEETEDLILRLSGMGAFMPLGVVPEYELGLEEYVPCNDDLIVDHVSIEDASLRAILAMLAPGKVPQLREVD